MTALLGKAGKKLFENHLENYAPADPLYEYYTDERGRQKRRKRELPPGLSARDAGILRSVKSRAHYLDKGFSLCGMRFGWTFFISLIPIVGDLTDASLNYFLVVRKARRADLPQWLVSRMMLNNAISLGVSFVPFVGDLVLAAFKANSRNAALLEEFLRIRGEEYLKLHPNGELEVVPGKKSKGGWFKSKKTPAASGSLTQNDAEQIKPGSGIKPGETVEQVQIVPSGPSGIAEEAPTPPQGSTGGRSLGSLFGRGRKPSNASSNNNLAPPGGERTSRFIENVSGSSAAVSTS